MVELSGTDAVYDFYLYKNYSLDENNGIVTTYNAITDVSQIKKGDILYRTIDTTFMSMYKILESPNMDTSNNRWIVKCNILSFDVTPRN